jgi:hypothetical protein
MENVNLIEFTRFIRIAQDYILQAEFLLKYLDDTEEATVKDKLETALEFTEDALEDCTQANSK